MGRIQVFNLILKETVARCLLKEFKGFLFLDTEFPKDLRAIENRKPENSQRRARRMVEEYTKEINHTGRPMQVMMGTER